ncbi:unnamed protein product, partial [Prorocentrum cordatum]
QFFGHAPGRGRYSCPVRPCPGRRRALVAAMRAPQVGLFLATFIATLHTCQAQIMSVDLGHEFFKVGLMRQGQPLEIVLNSHSKRKTTTVVSYFDTIRTFGDDALVHQGKAPAKTPLFFHSLLGDNFTSDAIAPGG